MTRKSQKIEDKVTIQAITVTFYCPYNDKVYSAILSEFDFHFWEQACDTCGSHRDLSIDIICPCGRNHEKSITGS